MEKNQALSQSVQSAGRLQTSQGKSMWLFAPDNCFRTFIGEFVKKGQFEAFILVLIAISSILLALDNPLNDPNS